MLYTAVIIGILAVTGFVIAYVVFALRALQSAQQLSREFVIAHNRTLKSLETIHDRNAQQLDSVLDRFMALDFSLFKAYQSSEEAELGGFSDPDEEGEVLAFTPGGQSRDINAELLEDLAARANEEQLLAEDFGLEFDQKEGLT